MKKEKRGKGLHIGKQTNKQTNVAFLRLILDQQLGDEVLRVLGNDIKALVVEVVHRLRHIRHRLQVGLAHEGRQAGEAVL